MTQSEKRHSRILVIDDDQDVWKAYRLVLNPEGIDPDSSSAKISQLLGDSQAAEPETGFPLSFASQGQEGYQMVAEAKNKDPFAVAFVDIRMPPGWDGMETAVKIREIDPDIELVIVTAYSDRTMEEIVRAVGSPDKLLFLRKPFDPEEIRQMARALSSKWHLIRDREKQQQAQRLLEQQLMHAQKMETIGTLAGGIAHDFNNILSAIMGYTDLALMRTQENTPLQDDLHQVRKAADRAADLVRQILTFSRRQQTESHPLQVSLVVKEALKLLRASIPTTIDIRQEITTQATVLADPTQIHQLIMNLCTNAFHAMMDRGGILGVSLTEVFLSHAPVTANNIELSLGRYVKLMVSDTGNGMDAETMTKIFEPYFTTKEKGKGTGLGLAVVHGIVENHHGGIEVASEQGRGTTFTVYLPMANQEAVAPMAPVVTHRQRTGERVAVVDDESTIRELIGQFLVEAGYRVDIFVNGMDAWQSICRTPKAWDLLITDQTMPGMTGEQLAAMLLSIRPEMPIILCSGNSELLDTDQTRKMGISACLPKPIGRNGLLDLVAKTLIQHGR
jgi:signal transduction histidine kinase